MRLGGVAEVRFTTVADGDLGHTPANRERLRRELGVRAVVFGEQVHGMEVALVHSAPDGYLRGPRADGQATVLRGVALAVHVADCLPVALAGSGGVAMLHAGWRGLACGVLVSGVRALRELGVEGELAAAIGPGAGGCCYEAGREVHAALGSRGSGLIDLKAIAAAQLRYAGVAQVGDCEICTLCADGYFSHRRGSAERQAGVVWRS